MTVSTSRRRFLEQLSAGAIGSLVPQLRLMAASIADRAKAATDHRALVCIYLAGGNDSFNMLVPADSAQAGSWYSTYLASRGGLYGAGGLGLGFSELRPIGTPQGYSSPFGLHPSCTDYAANGISHPGLASLYSQGQLAFVTNVGTLLEPTTLSNGAPLPPQLYSHSDQERLWHLGDATGLLKTGWGGRVMDLIHGSGALSPGISIAGNARLLIGSSTSAYQMSVSSGVTPLQYFSGGVGSDFGQLRSATLNQLLSGQSTSLLAGEYATLFGNARDLEFLLSELLKNAANQIATPYDVLGGSAPNPAAAFYPAAGMAWEGGKTSNQLLDQLRLVARMIKISRNQSQVINQPRQIYYVRLDGFDTHADQRSQHARLMARLSQALGWFTQAMAEIGASDAVTTFTMSDFGRTLSSNGDGSDHAWGGVQLVAGGSVAGGRLFGRHPRLVLASNVDGDYSYGRGQYIPSTSIEQMLEPLALWLGADPGAMDTVFPNRDRFDGPLALMA